jgi:exportin-1
VLITIDETGQPVKEELTNTENNAMYDLLRDLLINLAKLNWNYTKDIILGKLDKQVNNFHLKQSH